MISFDINSYTEREAFKGEILGKHENREPVKGEPVGSVPDYFSRLDSKMDFDKVFSIVKSTVRSVTGKERSGIGLALSDLPATLGAFWQVGGNYIVMNQVLIDAMTRMTSSPREFNSFIYMILTHEYIHSLGYIDEMDARRMTAIVAKKSFGENHPAFQMSNGDLWSLYPDLKNVAGGRGESIRIVGNFDSSSTSYIA